MSRIKNIIVASALVLVSVLSLTACGKGVEMTVVSVYSTGPEVVVVVEDDEGNQYKTRWGNTGPDAWTVKEGDTISVDLDAEAPYNEWTPIG